MSTIMKWVVNPMMRWLLKSPFHALVSRGMLLISVTGRKSGKLYQVPVAYERTNGMILIATRRSHHWWKNVRGGAPATLRLRGRDVAANAEVVEEENVVAEILQKHYRLVSLRPLTVHKAADLAAELIMVRVHLSSTKDSRKWTSAQRTSA